MGDVLNYILLDIVLCIQSNFSALSIKQNNWCLLINTLWWRIIDTIASLSFGFDSLVYTCSEHFNLITNKITVKNKINIFAILL